MSFLLWLALTVTPFTPHVVVSFLPLLRAAPDVVSGSKKDNYTTKEITDIFPAIFAGTVMQLLF